jgi:hypothetical protein
VFNRQGIQVGVIMSTPGTANICKSKYDIMIVCTKPGYQTGSYLNHSGTTETIATNVAADQNFDSRSLINRRFCGPCG